MFWPAHLPAPGTKRLHRGQHQRRVRWSPNQQVSAVPVANSRSTASPLTHHLLDCHSLYPTVKTPGTAYVGGSKALREVRCTELKNDAMTKTGAGDSRDAGAAWHQAVQPPVLRAFPHCSGGGRLNERLGILQLFFFFLIKLCCTVSFCHNGSGWNTMHIDLLKSPLSIKNYWKKYF